MAKKRLGDKAERVLRFLLGLRNRRIASALGGRGFTKDELEEGLSLLRAVATVSLSQLPPAPADPQVITALDAWENEWFPVANATLARHYPDVRDRVFLNLSQTEGPAVILSVGTFVDRIGAMTKAEGGYGQQGKDARKLLHKRGLTQLVVDRAKAMLEQVKEIEHQPDPPDLEAQRAEIAKAEEEMWAWYLEWSQIARSVIKDRGLLRQLGFLKIGGPGPGLGGGAPGGAGPGSGGGPTTPAPVIEDEGDEDEDDDDENDEEPSGPPAGGGGST